MGAVAAALRGRWAAPAPKARTDGAGAEPHELDFLKGLAQAFSGESCAFLPSRGGRADLRSYPVPEFLEQSGYNSAVNIAVTGNSGVGKSLFINTVRGVKAGEPTWAPVGVSDTTKDPVWYAFPKEPRVRLWDLEGALASSDVPCRRGPSDRSSVEGYIRNVGLRYFDVVLVLSSGRLTETEIEVTQELQARMVPFFFVRTKLDWDIENSEEDYGTAPEEVIKDIREDLQANDVPNPYLVNARSVEDHDFPTLIRDVLVVVAGRWPDLIEQSLNDITGEDPSAVEGKGDESGGALLRHEGQEPVEALARYNGRWYWVRDDNFANFLRGEAGDIAATVGTMLLGNPDHTWIILEDGRWELRVLNGATGSTPAVAYIAPLNIPTDEIQADFFGNTIVGRGVEYIVDGEKLLSEFIGTITENGKKSPLHYRQIREVVSGQYVMTWQNVTKKVTATRIFVRFPYFLLENETEETVELSTYSGWSMFIPSMTTEVPPGTHYVNASSKSVEAEKAIFKIGKKKLEVPELKAFQTFVLKLEDFSPS